MRIAPEHISTQVAIENAEPPQTVKNVLNVRPNAVHSRRNTSATLSYSDHKKDTDLVKNTGETELKQKANQPDGSIDTPIWQEKELHLSEIPRSTSEKSDSFKLRRNTHVGHETQSQDKHSNEDMEDAKNLLFGSAHSVPSQKRTLSSKILSKLKHRR